MPISDRRTAACALWLAVIPGLGAAQTPVPVWTPPVMSAVLPGSGQLVTGATRGVLYLALEAGLLTGHLVSMSAGRNARTRYRDIAFTVARSAFQPMTVDTAFQYFEAMSSFIRSGPFDTDPGPQLVPPMDRNTFNGRMWELARQTFFSDPASPPPVDSPQYELALDFYRRRAVGPAFEWSWEGEDGAMVEFRDELERSDEAFRRGTIFLGVVVANHLVSAIDAIVSARLRSARVGLRSGVAMEPGSGAGASWRVGVRVAF